MKIWHQSFTVLGKLPPYAEALKAHFKKVARPDTDIVMHGMHEDTYKTNYPGIDIRHSYFQHLHASQFVLGGIAAEEAGFDAYAMMTLPEPAIRDIRSLIDIPVVGYGESAMLTASMLGERIGVLLFIKEMAPVIDHNVQRMGFSSRFAGTHFVGFDFNDVLKGFDSPDELLERFHTAARQLIADGADVIIPGEAPLCVLLARHGVSRVDDIPVVDAIGATIKTAEMMVDLRKTCGLSPARTGYFTQKPPRERVRELLDFYGISRLAPQQT
jgi:allantoin racemase